MNEYPLLFTFRDIIEGNGFVAGVICNGRALMVNCGEEGWHISGVQPGALSELGGSPHEAYFYFRQGFTQGVKVLAADASDFADFERRLHAAFDWVDADEEARWEAAREQVRSGAEPDAPFKKLPKESAEEPRGIEAVRMDLPKNGPAAARAVAVTETVNIATERKAA